MSSYFAIPAFNTTRFRSASHRQSKMYQFLLLVLQLAILGVHRTECSPAVAREQLIHENPGYIPVYIRVGDTPLEEINEDLAAAFRSYAYKHYKLDYGDVKSGTQERRRKAEDNLILSSKMRKIEYEMRTIMEKVSYLAVLVIALLQLSLGQQNAGRSVAPALQECFNDTFLKDADNRLPTTINVLIDLIRKAESGRATQDARQMSIELIHRFRQDGILRSPNAVMSPLSLPFSPTGFQAERNILLLQTFIPGTAVNFPNETLNALERCSLHHMLSSRIDTTVRGDEATVCNRLGRYVRRTRSIDQNVKKFDPYNIQIRSNLEEEPVPAEGTENEEIPTDSEFPVPTDADAEILPLDPNARATTTTTLSECPVEGGVIHTRWGAVQAGTVIAAIAAGLEPQLVPEGGIQIDSRFVATLSGDLAEASLFQAGSTGAVRNIGAPGGWNSTLLPRWYFISQREHNEMTDADIRGGLDGLILAQSVAQWVGSAPSLRVSQILDMYYSRRGVFNETIRACNRYNLLSTVAPTATLQPQTTGFAMRLDGRVTFAGTIIDEMIPTIVSTGINMFLAYTPTINDLSCAADIGTRNRVATDIIIVLDTQWPHNTIHPTLAYLLDNLDVNRFGSSYTIINGNDGSIMVNTSDSIADYHQRFNLTLQQQHPTGFQYIRMINHVEQMVRNRADDDLRTGSLGLRSTIALLVPFQGTPNAEDNIYIAERLEIHRSFVPDLNILVLGASARDNYNSIVRNPASDIFTLTETIDSTNIVGAIDPLITRILEIPRRIINPNCGSEFNGTIGVASLDDFVEPQTTNFYRISPNFFTGDGARFLRIRGQGFGSFVACTSRIDSNPTQNSTAADLQCYAITSEEQSFPLTDFCVATPIRDCDPVFLSIQSTLPSNSFRCVDAACRFPDNIRYTLSLENFSCRSGSNMLTSGVVLVVSIMVAFVKLM